LPPAREDQGTAKLITAQAVAFVSFADTDPVVVSTLATQCFEPIFAFRAANLAASSCEEYVFKKFGPEHWQLKYVIDSSRIWNRIDDGHVGCCLERAKKTDTVRLHE